jgi:hypothetical protein
MSSPALVTFNPRPRIEHLHWNNGQSCFVIDDALVEPERLLAYAVEQQAQFRSVDFNAYPGVLLPAPVAVSAALNDFFLQHLRRRFDARRVIHMHSRLALVTLAPSMLRPYQWVCHRDSEGMDPQQSLQASVLYLFHAAELGGTSFYEPVLTPGETARLFHDASTLSNEAFTLRYGLKPGYLCGSNRYFTRVGSVAPKWNRLIFYDGGSLHSGDIGAPEKLSDDPVSGRLTLNGFFTCRRNAV